jgi:hypothetical protein
MSPSLRGSPTPNPKRRRKKGSLAARLNKGGNPDIESSVEIQPIAMDNDYEQEYD